MTIERTQPSLLSCDINIKYLAIVVMTIDHFATLFLPETGWSYLFCRSLGRMAAPLFAYLLVAGLLKSRDSNRYARRLLIYALISQFPYACKLGIARSQYWLLDAGFLRHQRPSLVILCAGRTTGLAAYS